MGEWADPWGTWTPVPHPKCPSVDSVTHRACMLDAGHDGQHEAWWDERFEPGSEPFSGSASVGERNPGAVTNQAGCNAVTTDVDGKAEAG